MGSPALELTHLKKTFRNDLLKKDQVVLDNFSCRFPAGECTGLLGHNGAGKTTAIRMILGMIRPDAGQILLDGKKITTQVKKRMGYMPEVNKIPGALTPVEILQHQLELYAPEQYKTKESIQNRIVEKLQEVGLAEHARKRSANLSKGMARRLAWSLATIHSPDFLILDEPSSGLDPLGRRHMMNWIEKEKARGTTIMLCTHELAQVNSLCDGFHILNQGRLVLTTHAATDGDQVSVDKSTYHWRSNYNVHVSGADEIQLLKLGKDHELLPWQAFKQEGYLAILGFAEYTDASAWLKILIQQGLVVVRFGDQTYVGEEELLPYFEGAER